MALFKLLCVPILMLTLLSKGCHSQLGECGMAPLNSKVVGGADAVPGSWPWQASLHQSGFGHFCGGSLINNQWVLTAAHCFPSTDPTNITVYLGRQSQYGTNDNEVMRKVTHILVHPDYGKPEMNNDMCLLRLASPVTFSEFIRPVCLAAEGSTINAGTGVWITGWGLTENNNTQSLPDILQEVWLPVVGNKKCNCDYQLGGITGNMMCAGFPEGGKDSCQGDSGGPLVLKNGFTWILVGVVSFGNGCALPGFPGVYARVSQFEGWINSHILMNRPGFVRYDSMGMDSDSNFQCPLTPHPTHAPTHYPPYPYPTDDSIFGGTVMIQSSYLTLLSLIPLVMAIFTVADGV